MDALETPGLINLLYTILGTKRERLAKEKQEYLAAKLKREETAKAVEETMQAIESREVEHAAVQDADKEYGQLIEEKGRLIAQCGDQRAEQFVTLSERLADVEADRKELQEAIAAGGQTAATLKQVESEHNSAKDWGTWDMLGGGVIVTWAKHSRIDAAKEHAYTSQKHLPQFQEELADADQRLSVSFDIGAFATFTDYFFDGLTADWIIPERVNRFETTVFRN